MGERIARVILRVVRGQTRGALIELGGSEIGIGSAAANGLVLVDPGVAERHCLIRMEQGEAILVPMGPVLVGGHPQSERRRLKLGDFIKLGDALLVIAGDQYKGCRRLLGIVGPVTGREFLLARTESLIGRSANAADIALCDPAASRRHTRIIDRQGTIVVEDLGSANGTLINGYRINRITPLGDGDILRAGNCQMVFLDGDPAPTNAVLRRPQTPVDEDPLAETVASTSNDQRPSAASDTDQAASVDPTQPRPRPSAPVATVRSEELPPTCCPPFLLTGQKFPIEIIQITKRDQ